MKVEMKDSGIGNIGIIPADWKICRLKDIGYLYGGLVGKSGDDFNIVDEDKFSYFIPFTNIFNNHIIDIHKLSKVKTKEGEIQNNVKKNDLLFLMSSEDYDGIGKSSLCFSEIENLYLNSFCKGFRIIDNEIYSKYLHYYLITEMARDLLRSEAKGFIRINLRQDKLACCPIIVPPFQLQQQIANFLDEKCADIDQLITLQQQMIDELKAYKQSVITEAVCKGLDKSVPMKDSGIEWIGEVPEGWKITKLKNVSKLKTGGTPNGYDNQSDFTTRKPWFTPSDFNENYKLIQSNRFLNLEVIENEKIILFPKHTVLMVCIGTVGKVGILTEEGYCNQQVTAIIPNGRMLPEYILYTLIAENKIIRDLANYTILPIINNSFLKEIILVCPTFEEQKNIVAFIEHKSSQIDTLISIKQQKIEELKEYKKSMIYEYITGKKQVPNN